MHILWAFLPIFHSFSTFFFYLLHAICQCKHKNHLGCILSVALTQYIFISMHICVKIFIQQQKYAYIQYFLYIFLSFGLLPSCSYDFPMPATYSTWLHMAWIPLTLYICISMNILYVKMHMCIKKTKYAYIGGFTHHFSQFVTSCAHDLPVVIIYCIILLSCTIYMHLNACRYTETCINNENMHVFGYFSQF